MDGRSKNFIMNLNENFMKKFGKSFFEKVKLSNYSWFNLGGNAEYFFRHPIQPNLKEFLLEAKIKKPKNITILGAGSNTLFRDNGVKGVVIKLVKDFSFIKIIKENIIEVGAATLDRKVADFAKENNLGNLEFLAMYPGVHWWSNNYE